MASSQFDGGLASPLLAPGGVILHDGLYGAHAICSHTICFDAVNLRVALVRQRQFYGELAASRRLNFSVGGSLCFSESPLDKLSVIRWKPFLMET